VEVDDNLCKYKKKPAEEKPQATKMKARKLARSYIRIWIIRFGLSKFGYCWKKYYLCEKGGIR
jgi:hypothetical protein